MSKDWTPEELQAASEAMKAMGHMGYEEFCEAIKLKAKFIERTYDVNKLPVLVYEYRGFRYEVIDYGWRGGEPLSWQHANEQARIDELIEREEKAKNSTFVAEPAEIGLEKFFQMFEQEGEQQ